MTVTRKAFTYRFGTIGLEMGHSHTVCLSNAERRCETWRSVSLPVSMLTGYMQSKIVFAVLLVGFGT
jgi:hypothetical protein